MWQAVRDFQQLVPTQANAPESGLAVGEEVPHLRQGICVDACAGHARPDAQTIAQLRGVRQALLAPLVAAGPLAVAHGREAVRMCALRKGLCGSIESAGAHADPFGRQEL